MPDPNALMSFAATVGQRWVVIATWESVIPVLDVASVADFFV